uniref:Uncharacterized protein n=1 Tax=Opuntia streptacantha TaxID=393608 RepID=A0A7C8Z432_OPUST
MPLVTAEVLKEIAENKTDCMKKIRLAGAISTNHTIDFGTEIFSGNLFFITLKPFNNNLLYVHDYSPETVQLQHSMVTGESTRPGERVRRRTARGRRKGRKSVLDFEM